MIENIFDMLQATSARVTYEDKWLVVDENGLFTVYQRKYGAKKTRKLIETPEEKEALKVLRLTP